MDVSNQDNQDQRTNSGSEDSNTMKLEFLRAQLLRERSVSKSARQRADELAKRVFELEEELRIVSLQRMKAEKATADVLAILESNGISDVSETYDPSSDQEGPYESKVGNNESSKNEENSVNSKVKINGSEEFSSSEFEFPPVPGRSLSWKGRSSHSCEKHLRESMSRRSSASFNSSPRHHLGRSCCQIRRKESRSIREESKANERKVNSQENEVATLTTSEVCSNCSDVAHGDRKGCQINEQNATTDNISYDVYGEEGDVEKALECQALLIDQYEEMEEAQREWEERFRENNNDTLESCDPGNRSDVTDERYKLSAEALHPPEVITSQTHHTMSKAEDLSETNNKSILLSVQDNIGHLQEHNNHKNTASESTHRDISFTTEKGTRNHESSRDSSRSDSAPNVPPNIGNNSSSGAASGSQTEPRGALVVHKVPDELGSVLEALKQAKQSLQRSINGMQFVEHDTAGRSVQRSVSTSMSTDKFEVPIGSVGLFRLPSDFPLEADTRGNASTWLSLGNTRPELSRSYFEPRSSFSSEGQFLTRHGMSRPPSRMPYYDPYLDRGLSSSNRFSTSSTFSQNPYLDPHFGSSLQSSRRYSYAASNTMSSPFHESMPRIHARENFPRPEFVGNTKDVPSRATGLPPFRAPFDAL